MQLYASVLSSVALAVLGVSVLLSPAVVSAVTNAHSTDTTTAERVVPDNASSTHDVAAVEEKVRALFKDAPAMIEVARCESKFRQYADSGNPFMGGAGNGMVGVFQFYERVHRQGALALGYDIRTLEGNLGYARYVYDREGTNPWRSSISCWQTERAASAKSNSRTLTKDLRMGDEHAEVRLLQELLNAAGYPVAQSGPGSTGNETMTFGSRTHSALRAFQCEKLSVCAGSESSTGYGFVGLKTRKALMQFSTGEDAKKSAGTTKSERTFMSTAEREAKIKELLTLVAELQKQLALLKTQ